MQRGNDLETIFPAIVKRKRPDWKLIRAGVYLRDPCLKLGCTPDFFIESPRGRGVLQAKTAKGSVFASQWDAGDGQIDPPFWTVLQTSVEAMLSDAAFAAIAVLNCDPDKWECYVQECERNREAEEKIINAVKEFWRAVETGDEPSPDFLRDADVLAAIVPRETPGRQLDLTANNSVGPLLELRADLMEEIKTADARKTAIETEIKFLLRDHDSATGVNGFRISFKTEERDGYSVPARSSRVLRITDRRPKEVWIRRGEA